MEALETHCERNSLPAQTTYVWICFACVNQHRVSDSVPFEHFRETFETQVTDLLPAMLNARSDRPSLQVMATGHVLSLIAPWSDPENLKRAWW